MIEEQHLLLLCQLNRYLSINCPISHPKYKEIMALDASQQKAASAVVAAAQKPGVISQYIDGEGNSSCSKHEASKAD